MLGTYNGGSFCIAQMSIRISRQIHAFSSGMDGFLVVASFTLRDDLGIERHVVD